MKKAFIIVIVFICHVCLADELVNQEKEISVSDVTISQNSGTKLVTVSYKLGELPAIITVDFLTNGVSIGEANFNNVFGAVNRLVVQTGTVHTIHWQPVKTWAGNSGAKLSAKVYAWSEDNPPDYLVVSLGDESIPLKSYYVSTNALPGGLANDAYRTSLLVMRRIQAAGIKWQMGATKADFEAANYNKTPGARETPHNVTLTYNYFIGIYPVTQEQYRRFTGATALGGPFNTEIDAALRPRAGVNYNGLRGKNSGTDHVVSEDSAIDKLRKMTGIDFDLPSDAEWEYACKAGTTHLLYTGEDFTEANLKKIAWFSGNSGGETHAVGKKLPNPWGLYDMIGNTLEWCRDKYTENLGTEDVENPIGTEGDQRVGRGSRYNYTYGYSRTTYRYGQNPAINTTASSGAIAHGLRVVCPITFKFPELHQEENEPSASQQ